MYWTFTNIVILDKLLEKQYVDSLIYKIGLNSLIIRFKKFYLNINSFTTDNSNIITIDINSPLIYLI